MPGPHKRLSLWGVGQSMYLYSVAVCTGKFLVHSPLLYSRKIRQMEEYATGSNRMGCFTKNFPVII